MLALTLEAIFENTRREKCAVLGRFWYIAVRPAPTRHVTSRQGCSCAGGGRQTRCGVLPITSCEFTQEEKRKQRGNDLMMPCSSRHSFRSFPQGGGAGEARTDRRASSPFSLSAGVPSSPPACSSARQPVRPIQRAHILSLTHSLTQTHTPPRATPQCRHRQRKMRWHIPSNQTWPNQGLRSPCLPSPRPHQPTPRQPPHTRSVRLPVATRSRETGSRVPNRHVGPCHPRDLPSGPVSNRLCNVI